MALEFEPAQRQPEAFSRTAHIPSPLKQLMKATYQVL